MSASMTQLVSDYLYEQRTSADSLSVEKLATTVAPLFQSARSETLNERLTAAASEMGGRLLLLDNDGKVQYDTFSRLCGTRLQLPEVLTVLTEGKNGSYGIHRLGRQDPDTGDADDYVAYCSARLTGTRGSLGVLLYVAPVQEMMDSLTAVSQRLAMIFFVVALVAMAVALVFSSVLTRPITGLTRTIQRMGRGDLSARAKVSGSGEIRNLAESYNTMAAQLESLDKSRNQFVSNASHELKTPMTTMKILLENIMYEPDMPKELRQEFLQDMNHEIDRLTGIITDLLTLTRMDNGASPLKMEQVDLTEVTREDLRLLKPMAEKRGQELTGDVETGCRMTGDRGKLAQVLYNLTDNAMKYTPDGGAIHVSLENRGKTLAWTVTDNGVGISKEDQRHIFERFYRVDKARSRETGGTGLGLSIVHQLVSQHGGSISVESEPGKGTAFTVELPVDGKEAGGR